MNIALLGYGKMGHIIENTAREKGITVKKAYDADSPLAADKAARRELEDVPVLIDFSAPEAVLDNVKQGAELGKNIVIGTTGWEKDREDVFDIAEKGDIGLVYGANFSLGVNLFYRVAAYAGSLMSSFDSYDPYVEESHHRFKKDAPSGTALTLVKKLKSAYSGDVPVTSVRAGYIPGTHTVSFDSASDSIYMTHRARSRQGFAEGALSAAAWIEHRKGVFEFDTVLDFMLKNGKEPDNE